MEKIKQYKSEDAYDRPWAMDTTLGLVYSSWGREHGVMSRFKNWKPPKIEHGVLNEYNWLVLYPDGLTLGKGSDIGALCVLMCQNGVDIGVDVQLGAGVKVYSGNTIDGKKGSVTIRAGASVGANAVILSGVIIGVDAVVGAGAIVKTDTVIPHREIWAGNPAKQIGKIVDGKRCYFSRAMWPETMG